MKRTVKSYSVTIEKDDNSEYVHLKMTTDRQTPHEYRIGSDTRHPDLEKTKEHLKKGLSEAQATGKKIDISDYTERMYVFIKTPIDSHANQYTAKKIS